MLKLSTAFINCLFLLSFCNLCQIEKRHWKLIWCCQTFIFVKFIIFRLSSLFDNDEVAFFQLIIIIMVFEIYLVHGRTKDRCETTRRRVYICHCYSKHTWKFQFKSLSTLYTFVFLQILERSILVTLEYCML